MKKSIKFSEEDVGENKPSIVSIFNKHPSKKNLSKKELRIETRDF